MTEQTIQEGKTLAIVSYITFVGLIIAIIMNLEKRNPFVFFHVRQMLGLIIMLIFSNLVEAYVNSWLGTSFWIITIVCLLFGLIYVAKGESRSISVLGESFKELYV